MPIRKGKLWKLCKHCGISYEPHGFYDKVCDDCQRKNRHRTAKNVCDAQPKHLNTTTT